MTHQVHQLSQLIVHPVTEPLLTQEGSVFIHGLDRKCVTMRSARSGDKIEWKYSDQKHKPSYYGVIVGWSNTRQDMVLIRKLTVLENELPRKRNFWIKKSNVIRVLKK